MRTVHAYRTVVERLAGASLVAVGAPRGIRRQMLAGSRAPSFHLPDLSGTLHSLEEFTDRKKLLFAFASW